MTTKISNKRSMPVSIDSFIAIAFATLFSSFTLILVESWIKYPLFVFEVIVTLIILVGLKRKFDLSIRKPKVGFPITWNKFLDLVLISFSIGLLVLTILKIESGPLRLLLALASTSFLSGFTILNLSGLAKYFTRLESYVLSFVLSFIFCAFLTLVLTNFDEIGKAIAFSSIFLLLGVLSIFKHKSEKATTYDHNSESLSRKIDLLPIVVTIAFYVSFFLIVYPSAALVPATDISRHLNYSLVLLRTPELYTETGSLYIFFHAFQAGFYVLSGIHQPFLAILSSLTILNVFLPLSVYMLAKKFLSDIDKRIPALSLLLYSFTSGLSFIYYTELSLISQTAGIKPEYGILAQEVAEKSYFGIINPLQPFHFFVPISVSFIILCTVLMLLRSFELSRTRFICIFSVLLISMYLVHVTESIVFVLILALYSLFSKGKELRLFDGLISSLISFSVIGLFLIVSPNFFGSEVIKNENDRDDALLFIKIAPVFVLGACIIWHWKILSKLTNYVKKEPNYKKLYNAISYLLVVAYLIGIILWMFVEEFKSSAIFEIGIVPSFIYPIMLGIVGLLAILALRVLSQEESNHGTIKFVIVGIGFSFVIGKLISYTTINLVEINYWEKRFVMIIFLFCSLLAPLTLIRISDYIKAKRKKISSNVILSAIISSIVIFGFSSLAIQYEYWYVTSTGVTKMSDYETQAVTYLKEILQKDKRAFVVTPTEFSRLVLAYAGPAYQFPKPDMLFNAQYPQVALMSLNVKNLDHAYVYLHSRDIGRLNNNFDDSWFKTHLLPILPLVFSNKEVKIFNVSSTIIPQPNSESQFLTPWEPHSKSWLYAYDILHQSRLNYTELYGPDANVFSSKNLIIPVDPQPNYEFYDNLSSDRNNIDKWNEISGNWNFTSDGLQGKRTAGLEREPFSKKSVILSSIYPGEGRISVLFRIKDVNPEYFSYVSIVTAWKDSKNHEFAGLATYHNQIYSYFGKVTDGKLSFEPDYPFLNTGMRSNSGTTLNLTLSINNVSQDLYINGTKYLRNSTVLGEGPIGLSFSRVNDLTFYDFRVEHNSSKILGNTDTKDFFEFVRKGGNLFVLNNDGYGEIAEALNSSNYPMNFTELIKLSPGNHLEAENGNLSKADRAKDNIFNTLIREQDFFILNATFGQGNIVYVNIHPLLSRQVTNDFSRDSIFRLLEQISKIFSAKDNIILDPSSSSIRTISAFFKEMDAAGRIKLDSSSIVIPESDKEYTVEIYHNGASKAFFNSSIISAKLNSNISIFSDSINIKDGKGLYSNLLFKRSPVILVPDKNATIDVRTNNGSYIRFASVSNLTLFGFNNMHIYAKQPTISVDGKISFVDFDGARFLYSNLAATKKTPDISFKGKLNSSVIMSDQTSLLDRISLDGSFNASKYDYDELSSIITNKFVFNLYDLPLLIRGLLLIPFIVSIVVIFYKKIF